MRKKKIVLYGASVDCLDQESTVLVGVFEAFDLGPVHFLLEEKHDLLVELASDFYGKEKGVKGRRRGEVKGQLQNCNFDFGFGRKERRAKGEVKETKRRRKEEKGEGRFTS